MGERIFVSFSGGRTSAFMTKWIWDTAPDDADVRVLFANTGQEDERTLEFVHEFSKRFKIPVIWLEAVVSMEPGVGPVHKRVTFKTASRDGRPYEESVKKYGLFSPARPMCTKSMKLDPMRSYLRSIGWKKGTYRTAIGIRADEIDRVNPKYKERMLWYPLATLGIKKPDIIAWWKEQDFDLQIEEHEGNCLWCFKKSIRKHLTLIRQRPEVYDFPRMLEEKYSMTQSDPSVGPRRIFRGKQTVDELFHEAHTRDFKEFSDAELDMSSGCSESCEVFTGSDWEDAWDEE